ncbi:MAG: metallophosphoesterase family protein [Candidatus Hodarchaeales archaeon]|jgi:putative phosphoesterase
MITLGIISDTHVPTQKDSIPPEVKKIFKEVDFIVHAGDIESLQATKELEKIAPLIAVSGNMCNTRVKQKYPRKKILNFEGVKIGLTHGSGGAASSPSRLKSIFTPEKPDLIIFGHTHQPMAEVIDDILYLNPGSPISSRYSPSNTVMILQIHNSKYEYEIIDIN